MGSWRYKTVQIKMRLFRTQINAEEIERTLNEMNSQGWELYSSIGVNGTREILFVFRRPA